MEENKQPGKGYAIAAFVLGLLSFLLAITGPIALILAIVALCLASKAKKMGYQGGLRKAGKVLAIIGLIFAIIMTIVMIFGSLLVKDAVTTYLEDLGAENIGELALQYIEDPEFEEIVNLLDEETKNELIEDLQNENYMDIIENYNNGDYNAILEAFGMENLSIDEIMNMASEETTLE